MINLGLALASALLLIVLFPGWDLTFLAPVALAPLLLSAARERDGRRRLINGLLAGTLYWGGVCHWILFVVEHHGGMTPPLSWLAFALFALAKGALFAAFAYAAGPLMRRPWAVPAAAALWTGLERLNGPLGFAWLLLGNAGSDMGLPMRLAPITGAYGISFVFALMSAAFATAILRLPRLHLAPLLALPLLLLLPPLPPPVPGSESAAVVQPNVPQSQAWTEESLESTVRRVAAGSLQAALEQGQPEPALLLWPENPAPFYYYSDRAFRDEANRIARVTGTPFLFGTVGFTPSNSPLNSAVLLAPSGKVLSRYDKMYLVPFGEFVPPLFSWVNRITQEAGDFSPGREVVVSPVGSHRLGTFICYESAFPELVRRFANQGGEVLVNLTNDGYFGRSAARRQHLLLARMRAAENRRWLLRPTNDGYTVSIDPAGRPREALPAFEFATGRLKFSWIQEKTLYTRLGDWFAWTCLVLGLGGFLAALMPRYHPKGGTLRSTRP
ncbi:MAG: apolipoprotein N-acyltransferase [Bryobacteraceae bacterium]